jgi:hypothetical protein
MRKALWGVGLCGLLSVRCSSTPAGAGAGDGGVGASDGGVGAGDGGGGGSSCSGPPSLCPSGQTGAEGGVAATSGNSLIGTWNLTTTSTTGTDPNATTIVIGQDSLTVTSPGNFALTAVRAGNTLAFIDEQTPGEPGNNVTLTAMQTAASFDAGILPFDLGGTWSMQIVPAGQTTVMTCTLSVSAGEIDGACRHVTDDGFDFSFTTKKMSSAASSFGDFGGTWLNTWTWPGDAGGSYPCAITFSGNDITTCAGVIEQGSQVTGISFTYDGADTTSGTVQGWGEYSATRQ